MPFLLPAAATAVAAAAPAAAAAATTAAATAGITATLTSVATNILMNVAISAVMSALSPQVGAAGRTFEWTLDPDGPIPFAAGRIGVAGSAVYRETFGPDLMYYGIPSVISGAGPIDGFESFLADDESVTFDGTGKAVSSQYAGELWYKNSLGAQPATAIASPTGLKNSVVLPGWSSASKLSGKASYMIVMGENSKGTAFPTGEIKPLVTVRGLKGWDPRRDSTYPGGSGSCRLNDPSTWVYLANPILWALKWSLGLWEGPTGKGAPQVDYQVGGIGAKLAGIDVPAFVAAANVADANGWTVAAYPTTDDDKAQVLDAFLQAGGATYAQRSGKISCIQRAAPRTSIVTISGRDTAGPLEIDTAASRIDRINTIRPRYWSEAHRWQLTALPEVTAAAYQTQDGGKRTRGIDYPYVTNPVQAAQLAALQIANTREGIAGVIPLKPHLQRIRPGDAFTITEEDFVLNGVKCLCLNTDYDPATGIVRVSFVSETDAKYPFALGQSPDVPVPPVLTPVDHSYVRPPAPEDWTVVVTPPAPGGTLVPGIDLTGVVMNETADAMLISWRAVADGEDPDTPPAFFVEVEGEAPGPKEIAPGWVDAGIWPPTTKSLALQGPQPRTVIWIAIRYKRGSNVSDPLLKGPLTVSRLVASDVASDNPMWAQVNANTRGLLQGAIDDLFGLFDEEEGRARDIADILDRLGLGFILDPVERTALVRTDTLFEGVGPSGLNETLVQTTLRLTAVDAVNASATAAALINARAYTDALRTEANLTFATQTGLNGAISGARGEWQSYATAAAAGAVIGLDTVAARESALALARGQWESYASAAAANATIGLVTGAALATSLASARGQWESYATAAAASATAGLDTVAAREGAISATILSLQSYTNTAVSTSAATLATQTSLNGVSAIASLALGTANGSEAYAALQTEVGGRITGARINGTTGVVEILSEIFRLTSNGSGTRTEYRDGIWYIYDPASSTRAMYGKPFGGSDKLTWWTGPAATAAGSETKANAYVYISTVSPRFGGSDVAGGATFTVTAPLAIQRTVVGGTGTITTAPLAVVTSGATGTITWTWNNVFGDPNVAVGGTSTPTFSGNPVGVSRMQAIFAYSAADSGTGITRYGQVAVTINRDA